MGISGGTKGKYSEAEPRFGPSSKPSGALDGKGVGLKGPSRLRREADFPLFIPGSIGCKMVMALEGDDRWRFIAGNPFPESHGCFQKEG